jgi:rhodanese-related sulfurtransferase/rubrerythrin
MKREGIMGRSDIQNIRPEAFTEYTAGRREGTYTLVDVREPSEYGAHHIPGAKLLPLGELEERFDELPDSGDVIFYCASGNRSTVAGVLVSDAREGAGTIYNLVGGIHGWTGETLVGLPRVRVFDKHAATGEVLMTAMNLEKGAQRYYEHVAATYPAEPFATIAQTLSKAEAAHARLIYGHWKAGQKAPPPFESVYDGLTGDIMEGGDSLADMITATRKASASGCLGVLDLALHIEYCAFDLYRTIADSTAEPIAREAFLAIAQAEKNHIRSIAAALSTC